MTTEPKPPLSGAFILQAVGIIAAVVMVFTVVQRDGETNRLDIADHEARIRALEKVNAGIDARLARIEEQLIGLKKAIDGAKP